MHIMASQGEMGATVMRYPNQYAALLPEVRDALLGQPPATSGAAPPPSDTPLKLVPAASAEDWRSLLPGAVLAVVDGNSVQAARLQQQQSGAAGRLEVKLGLTFNFVSSDGSQVRDPLRS